MLFFDPETRIGHHEIPCSECIKDLPSIAMACEEQIFQPHGLHSNCPGAQDISGPSGQWDVGEILAIEELTNDVWWVLNSIDTFYHMALSVRFLGKNTPKSTVVVIIFHHFTTSYCLFGVYGTRFLDPDIFWTSATRPRNLRILCWNIHHELVPSPMNGPARPGPERCHQGGHRTWHHRALRRRGWVSGWKWHGTGRQDVQSHNCEHHPGCLFGSSWRSSFWDPKRVSFPLIFRRVRHWCHWHPTSQRRWGALRPLRASQGV